MLHCNLTRQFWIWGFPRRSSLRFVFGLVVSIALCSAQAAFANGDAVTKAKFLYNLALLSEWPKSSFSTPNAPFHFCTLHAEDVSAALNFMAIGKEIDGHTVRVIEIQDPAETTNCQILFSSITRNSEMHKLGAAVAGKQIMSVADSEEFAERGGSIGLSMVDGKIKFTVNGTNIARTQIQVDKRLLKLGKVIW